MIKYEEEIKYTLAMETHWGPHSAIPYVYVQEEMRKYRIENEEFMAFMDEFGARVFQFPKDALFMIPWHFDGVRKAWEERKKATQKCAACGCSPSLPKKGENHE